jgi:hypothetical protein
MTPEAPPVGVLGLNLGKSLDDARDRPLPPWVRPTDAEVLGVTLS